jgi:hypothetical protein
VFLQVFQTYVASVSNIFERTLQMFYLDVSKVDQVLHLSHLLLLPRFLASVSPLLDVGDVRTT